MSYILQPSSFYIGDKVKLFYPLPKNHRYKDGSFRVEKIEQNDGIFIDDISITVINNTDYLLITFIPWQAGEVEFPSLENIGIDINLPNISVLSVLDEKDAFTQTLQEPRAPILLDGTVYLLYKYVVSSVLICLFLIFIIIALKKKGRAFFDFIIKKRTILLFYLNLYRLQAMLKRGEKIKENDERLKLKNEWIKSYEHYLRSFIFSIYNIKNKTFFASLTYEEINDLIKTFNEQSVVYEHINSLFQKLYILRFSDFDILSLLQERALMEASFKLLKTYRKKSDNIFKK